ncbi:hypothetical protein GGU10DRAFT_389265 [Lentinula aff. detonsa]|uniref:Uncharacterized protein n=1 Tax=Lentinula aff. detonsa TaxID=2804958 RepID=A0AA38NP60_9AGAR|nr:hypothetical protein GGU10DRAFT_389265 [Lentinula aff. detonsa]
MIGSGEYTLITSDSDSIMDGEVEALSDIREMKNLHRASSLPESASYTKALPPLPSSDQILRHGATSGMNLEGAPQGDNASISNENPNMDSNSASQSLQFSDIVSSANGDTKTLSDDPEALSSTLLNMSIRTYADATNIANLYPELAPTVLTMPLSRKSVSLPEPPRKEIKIQTVLSHPSNNMPAHTSEKPNWAVAPNPATDVFRDIGSKRSDNPRRPKSNKTLPPSSSHKKGLVNVNATKTREFPASKSSISSTHIAFGHQVHEPDAKHEHESEHGYRSEAPQLPPYTRSSSSLTADSYRRSDMRDKPLPPQPIPSYKQHSIAPTLMTHITVDHVRPSAASAWGSPSTDAPVMLGNGSKVSASLSSSNGEAWKDLGMEDHDMGRIGPLSSRSRDEFNYVEGNFCPEDDIWTGSLPASAYGGRSGGGWLRSGRGGGGSGCKKGSRSNGNDEERQRRVETSNYNQRYHGDPSSALFTEDYNDDYDDGWTGSLPASAYGAMSSRNSGHKGKGQGRGGRYPHNDQDGFRSRPSDISIRDPDSFSSMVMERGFSVPGPNFGRDHSMYGGNRENSLILGDLSDASREAVGCSSEFQAEASPDRFRAVIPRDVKQSTPHADQQATSDAMDNFWQNVLNTWNTDVPKSQPATQEETQDSEQQLQQQTQRSHSPQQTSSVPSPSLSENTLLEPQVFSSSDLIGFKAKSNTRLLEQRSHTDRIRVEAQVAGVIAATQRYLSSTPSLSVMERGLLYNGESVGPEPRARVSEAVKISTPDTTTPLNLDDHLHPFPRRQGGRNLIRTPPEEVPSGWHQERSASSSASSVRGRPPSEALNVERVHPSAKCGAPATDGSHFNESSFEFGMPAQTPSKLLQDVHRRINTPPFSVPKMGSLEMNEGGEKLFAKVIVDIDTFEKENAIADISTNV